MDSETKNVLREVIARNGSMLQMIVAMEELSELQKEISKSIRGYENRDAVIEEMSDVYIMLMQLEIILGISLEEVISEINVKMERLKERLEGKENESL